MTSSPGPAQEAWVLLHQFVEQQDRRGELAATLGFRLGAGRGTFLLHLREGPRTLKELAEVHGTDAPYATLVVDKLESQGLVHRRPHPDDRRRKLVELTEVGHDAVRTVESILQRPPAAMEALSTPQLDQLSSLLTELLDAGRDPLGPEPDPSRS